MPNSARTAMGAWYKHCDGKGDFYSPSRRKRKHLKSMPVDPQEVCSLLNNGDEWELHETARFAFKYEYEEHNEKEAILPNGAYYYDSDEGNEYIRPLELRTDKFIRIPDQHDSVIQDVKNFLAGERKYADL